MRFVMRFGLAAVLAAIVLAGVNAPAIGVTPNGDSPQGAWQLSSGEADGKALSQAQLKDGKLVIQDAGYTVTLTNIGTITGTQKLDAMQKPKTIDITDATGPHSGKTCLGIYELNENEFRVVFASPGGVRPSKFETKPESGHWMHVWKRLQK
jgi:uncharacterized protein (TIGR03067 family)